MRVLSSGCTGFAWCGPPQHRLSSKNMARITSDCVAMCIHEQQMALITSDCAPFSGRRPRPARWTAAAVRRNCCPPPPSRGLTQLEQLQRLRHDSLCGEWWWGRRRDRQGSGADERSSTAALVQSAPASAAAGLRVEYSAPRCYCALTRLPAIELLLRLLNMLADEDDVRRAGVDRTADNATRAVSTHSRCLSLTVHCLVLTFHRLSTAFP